MAAGSGLVERAKAHIGEEYRNRQVPKDDPNYRGPWDCAEFASWLVYQETGRLYGCTDNGAKPSLADAYTGAWKRDSNSIGKRISIEEAAATPGAFLLRYPPVDGAMGHIALSDGKGGTIEAKGLLDGVVADKVAGRPWNTGVIVPYLDYEVGTVTDVPRPTQLYAMGTANMDPAVVTNIQTLLRNAGFDPGPIDGLFGKETAEAVARFQRAIGIVADGEVGPETAAKLGIDLLGLIPPIAVALGITNPFVALGLQLVPALAGLLRRDTSGEIGKSVANAVERAAGTNNPAEAKQKIATDPAIAQTIQGKVEQVARDLTPKAAGVAGASDGVPSPEPPAVPPGGGTPSVPPAALAPPERTADVIAAETDSSRQARDFALKIAERDGPLARGPLVISIFVLVGFFATVVFFLTPGVNIAKETQTLQIIYIIVGTITSAFATVISFWLGSSQGSRFKDAAAIGSQVDRAAETDRVLREQARSLDLARKTSLELAARGEKPQETKDRGFSNFDRCLNFVLTQEGDRYVDHPADNGGPTRYGITLKTLRAWRERQGIPAAQVTAQDVEKLDKDEVCEIYRTRYWNELNCGNLPKGVDLIVFDFGVNAGNNTAAKLLQKVVGAEADGSIGPATIAAASAADPAKTIEEMSSRRLEYYRKLDDWSTFGNGWTRRVDATKTAALDMLKSS